MLILKLSSTSSDWWRILYFNTTLDILRVPAPDKIIPYDRSCAIIFPFPSARWYKPNRESPISITDKSLWCTVQKEHYATLRTEAYSQLSHIPHHFRDISYTYRAWIVNTFILYPFFPNHKVTSVMTIGAEAYENYDGIESLKIDIDKYLGDGSTVRSNRKTGRARISSFV